MYFMLDDRTALRYVDMHDGPLANLGAEGHSKPVGTLNRITLMAPFYIHFTYFLHIFYNHHSPKLNICRQMGEFVVKTEILRQNVCKVIFCFVMMSKDE